MANMKRNNPSIYRAQQMKKEKIKQEDAQGGRVKIR